MPLKSKSKAICQTLAGVTGKRVYDPTVCEWLDKWVANETGAVSDGTLTRFGQVVEDFLVGLCPVANPRLEPVTSGSPSYTMAAMRGNQEIVTGLSSGSASPTIYGHAEPETSRTPRRILDHRVCPQA
jgi:hypothetical protein